MQQLQGRVNEGTGKYRRARALDILSLARKYPIPTFALTSLIVGSILHYALGFEDAAHWLWIGTLLIGGAPVVFETIK